jgi:hypothetical protein
MPCSFQRHHGPEALAPERGLVERRQARANATIPESLRLDRTEGCRPQNPDRLEQVALAAAVRADEDVEGAELERRPIERLEAIDLKLGEQRLLL